MVQFGRDWLNEIRNMERQMDRLLDYIGHTKPPEVYFAPTVWEPPVDVYETADEIVVAVDLAGIDREKLEVVVETQRLVIRGKRRETEAQSKKSYHQMEIQRGPFERSIALPRPVDPDEARAFYDDGLLKVVLPKTKRSQTVEVRIRTIS